MRRMLAAGATGLILVLAMTNSPGAVASAGSGVQAAKAQPRAAKSYTRITLNVDTCAHCPVRLVQAVDGRPFVWDSRTKHLDHGVVSFRVPTRRTHNMSFEIDPR